MLLLLADRQEYNFEIFSKLIIYYLPPSVRANSSGQQAWSRIILNKASFTDHSKYWAFLVAAKEDKCF